LLEGFFFGGSFKTKFKVTELISFILGCVTSDWRKLGSEYCFFQHMIV